MLISNERAKVHIKVESIQMILLICAGEELPMNVRLLIFLRVIFSCRMCSPGRKTIVVSEVKYCSVSATYSESVWQGSS